MCPACWCGTGPLAQMGSANEVQTNPRQRMPLPEADFIVRRFDRLSSSAFAFDPSALARGSDRNRRVPVTFSARQHRPDHPGDLIRQRDRRDLPRTALQQLQQPGGRRPAGGSGAADHCHGPQDQQLPQSLIAGLAVELPRFGGQFRCFRRRSALRWPFRTRLGTCSRGPSDGETGCTIPQ